MVSPCLLQNVWNLPGSFLDIASNFCYIETHRGSRDKSLRHNISKKESVNIPNSKPETLTHSRMDLKDRRYGSDFGYPHSSNPFKWRVLDTNEKKIQ